MNPFSIFLLWACNSATEGIKGSPDKRGADAAC